MRPPGPSLAALAVVLLAFALRVAGLQHVPPGWRDDEVIETTVHAQAILDGGRPLFFVQAEGHEPLYHYLSAGWIALAGRSLFSVRMVSVFFGLLAVAACYRVARQLFGARLALLGMLLMAAAFWAMVYSRVKIRHIAELPFTLLAFSSLLRVALPRPASAAAPVRPRTSAAVLARAALAGLFIALALYTYLAALTTLLILAGLGLFLILRRQPFSAWRSVAVTLVVALALYLPLAVAIARSSERLAVVGGPLASLRDGDARPALRNLAGTLAMFGSSGDPEALYNIPGRPVFNVVSFYFFAGGLLISLWNWRDVRHAFVLIWLAGGLAPGVLSTPPASFGHTITSLPAVYILAALPVVYFSPRRMPAGRPPALTAAAPYALGALLVAAVALPDLSDYAWRWPSLPEVRYLYKADLHDAARRLRAGPPRTYVLSGPLSIWDRRAFALEGVPSASPPRWVNSEWAIVFPPAPAEYLFDPADWQADVPPEHSARVGFANDLVFAGWDQRGRDVIAHWQAGPAYGPAEPPIGASVASPSFPAFAFLHLLTADGSFVDGSDRFDVDAFSLQPGDRFLQRHAFNAPGGAYLLQIGLYNPVSGERILSADGRDAIPLGPINLP